MNKIFFSLILLIAISSLQAQTAKLTVEPQQTNTFTLLENRSDELTGVFNIGTIQAITVNTEQGKFIELLSNHLTKDFTAIGNPNLPVYNQLLEIPEGKKAIVKVVSYDTKLFHLNKLGLTNKIIPTQPSLPKNEKTMPFYYNKAGYQQNGFTRTEIAQLRKTGVMRGVAIGRLTIKPFQYNPLTNELKVFTNIVVKVQFEQSSSVDRTMKKQALYSPYFENFFTKKLLNYHSLKTRDTLTHYPISMVVVADPMFRDSLSAFIKWKTMQGFYITVAYTDDANVGTSTDSIHNYLKSLYDNATPERPAPSFVLFVGDIAEIPAYYCPADNSLQTSEHYTDLYYVTFDGAGDIYPDIYFGRWSAENMTELNAYIDKTLEFEQYTMPNPSYLNNAIMVAGVDANFAPTYGNGQISYGCDNYFNTAHGFVKVSEFLYQTDSTMSSDNSATADSVHATVSEGVGFANYTAHCSPDGWADPSFTRNDITHLNNDHKYCVMIGNCCQSNKFDESDAFGEKITYTPNKGAVAYIGGSQYTMWDEDYWWGVGATAVKSNPVYDTHLGVYDKAFHDHGETKDDWFITTSQMIVAGDMAVTEAGSSIDKYYWEIYHVMGDPSLMPYFAEPNAMTVDYVNVQPVGITSLEVTTEPNAYVAISLNGTLLDAQIVDSSGSVTLSFDAITELDTAKIVVTKQNRQPYIGDLLLISPDDPFVVYDTHQLNDSLGNNNGQVDYNDTVLVDLQLRNLGMENADSVDAVLQTDNSFITLLDTNGYYGTIDTNSKEMLRNAFKFVVADSIQDQEKVKFTIITKDDSGNVWHSKFNAILNAPLLKIKTISLIELSGNGNGRMDGGESFKMTVSVYNQGHAGSPISTGILITTNPYVTIADTIDSLGIINASDFTTATYVLTVDTAAPISSFADFKFEVKANAYGINKTFSFPVNLIVEDWEADTMAFNWQNDKSHPWTLDSLHAYQGENSYRSGHISDNQKTEMKLTVNILQDDTMSFYKKVSCEKSDYAGYWFDNLKFTIDGVVKGQWDGKIGWSKETYPITSGKHTLAWTYSKDESAAENDDAVWIDFIVLPPFERVELPPDTDDNGFKMLMPLKSQMTIYPNPAKDIVYIDYTLTENAMTDLILYDVTGKKIAVLLDNEKIEKGHHVQSVALLGVKSGIYFVALKTKQQIFVKRLIIK